MERSYTYEATLAASQKASWRVEDLIGGDKQLDFGKPFLPESLARVAGLDFLSPDERQLLNQIRGHDYLYLFGAGRGVHPALRPRSRPAAAARRRLSGARAAAVRRRGGEAHPPLQALPRGVPQRLRHRLRGDRPAEEIARAVLSHHPLAVALVILQIEWMTQRHYVESVRDDADARPAVQEPAAPPLDGGGAARQARHAHGRDAGRKPAARRRSQRAVEDYAQDRRLPRRRLAQQVEVRPRQLRARHRARLLPAGQRAELIEAAAPGDALDLPRLRHDPPALPRDARAACRPRRGTRSKRWRRRSAEPCSRRQPKRNPNRQKETRTWQPQPQPR